MCKIKIITGGFANNIHRVGSGIGSGSRRDTTILTL
jgi:hypothetical protein